MRYLLPAMLCLTLLAPLGCQQETPPPERQGGDSSQTVTTVAKEPGAKAEQPQEKLRDQQETAVREPPGTPVFENFQGEPKLSLFPWAGDFRPADLSDHLTDWQAAIASLIKTTGIAEDQATGQRGWVFGSIEDFDSAGYFAPLAVAPGTRYRVSFSATAQLAEGSAVGVSILEFKEFLWTPGQYTEVVFRRGYCGSHDGQRLTGTVKGEHSFTFTTGPETHMIHLVLFRSGAHDDSRVMFDDLAIEVAQGDG